MTGLIFLSRQVKVFRSAIRLFHFLIRMFAGIALLICFKIFSLVFII